MPEYFIVANSFAAPFASDTSEEFVEGVHAREALSKFVAKYSHPYGLYSAKAWNSANDYHKNLPAVATWLSNKEIAIREATKNLPAYEYRGGDQTTFYIDGKKVVVEHPKGGAFV